MVRLKTASAETGVHASDLHRNLNAATLRAWVAEWGFHLFPRLHPASPGFSGLLVAIRAEEATSAYYVPAALECRLCDERGYPEWVRLHERPHFRDRRRVCTGRITLHDEIGKRLACFSFGGQLEVLGSPGETFYALRSPAPILVISPPRFDGNADKLAFNTEALLARQLAAWGTNSAEFQERLATADPFDSYVAAVNTLIQRYEEDVVLREAHAALYRKLCVERKWLDEQGKWPVDPPTMAELLGPGARPTGTAVSSSPASGRD